MGRDIVSLHGEHVQKIQNERDSFSNQFTTRIEVASTTKTEEVEYNGVTYKWYPKIREEDIGKDTSKWFKRFNSIEELIEY